MERTTADATIFVLSLNVAVKRQPAVRTSQFRVKHAGKCAIEWVSDYNPGNKNSDIGCRGKWCQSFSLTGGDKWLQYIDYIQL